MGIVIINVKNWMVKDMSRRKREYWDKHRKLGTRIAYFRKLQGLSQEEFAEKLGYSRQYIGAIEAANVQKAVGLDFLFRIAEVFDVKEEWFFVEIDTADTIHEEK